MNNLNTSQTEHTLPNGLRIIFNPVASDVTYCGFAVNAGTRDEAEHEHGMAHFVEHLLFKGTQKRKAWHILNRMEAVGGDLNAYTNKEETVIYSTFLTKDLARAVDLLVDIVFRSTFPQHEIVREAAVVLDEIQSYEDSPGELIFDDFEDMIFKDHALGHSILGNPELLRQFQKPDLLSFTRRFYQPSNMIFFVQGKVDFKKLVRQLEKLMADIPWVEVHSQRTPPSLYVPHHLVVNKDTHQAHVMLGNRAYQAHDDKRTALYLINNILGGPGMNSRLNVSLRERRGLVYTVESNLASYLDTSVFSVYFGTDPDNVDACLQLIHKELKRMRDVQMTTSQLEAAKKQLVGQICVSSDNNENNALGMAKSFLQFGKYEGIAKVCDRIRELTCQEIIAVANETLAEEQLSSLIFK